MYLRLVISAWVVLVAIAGAAAAQTEAAIVVDARSGQVLYERRADAPIYPASLTKMMTLYLLFEAVRDGRLDLDGTLTVSRHAASMPASRLGLRAGERMRVEDAIRALIVKSANDVAVVVAEALGKTESGFARLMTNKARALGMSRTTFVNASGLPNDQQSTTVRDLSILARRLMADFPQFYDYFATERFHWKGRVYRSHNRLLGRYPGADGLKTGYIRASGYNLAASAERNGRRVIAVYVGGRTARSRDDKVAQLLDLGFEQLRPAALVAHVPPQPRPAATTLALPAADSDEGDAALELPGRRPVAVAAAEPAEAVSAASDRTSDTSLAGEWGVQIGAYLKPEHAYRAAYGAVRQFPDLLLGHEIEISPRQGRRKTYYRVRLAGFGEERAQQVCRQLKRQQQECLVVRYEEPVTIASR